MANVRVKDKHWGEGERLTCFCSFPRKNEKVAAYPLEGTTVHRACSSGMFKIESRI